MRWKWLGFVPVVSSGNGSVISRSWAVVSLGLWWAWAVTEKGDFLRVPAEARGIRMADVSREPTGCGWMA